MTIRLLCYALILLLPLVAIPVVAGQWCYGAAAYSKEKRSCVGEAGWTVVETDDTARREGCFLRSVGKSAQVYITADTLFMRRAGGAFDPESGGEVTVDDNEPVIADLMVPREGMEFSDPAKRPDLTEQFKKGIAARFSAANSSWSFSLIGFTKAHAQFADRCLPAESPTPAVSPAR